MVWVGLDEVVVAGVGVGRGERAGGDHGEVQDGGWGVGVSLLDNKSLHLQGWKENYFQGVPSGFQGVHLKEKQLKCSTLLNSIY